MPSHDDEMRNEKYTMERDSESFNALGTSTRRHYGIVDGRWRFLTDYFLKENGVPDKIVSVLAKHGTIANAVVAEPDTVVEFKDSSQMREFQIIDNCLKGNFF